MYSLSRTSTETCVAFALFVPLILYGTVTVLPFLVTSPLAAMVMSPSNSVSLYSAPVSPAVPEMTDEKRTDDRFKFKAGLTPVYM